MKISSSLLMPTVTTVMLALTSCASDSKLLNPDFMKSATPQDIETAIASGEDANQRKIPFVSDTPLIIASKYNQDPNLIKMLLENGADPNASDGTAGNNDWTPLIFAAKQNNAAVVKALIDGGAIKGNVYRNGGRPLDMAARYNEDADVTRLLYKPDNYYHRTGKWLAAQYNKNPEVIKIFIESGADMDEEKSYGDIVATANETPLMLAIGYNENPDVAVAIIEGGANPNLISTWHKEASGMTPLMLAAKLGETSVVKSLIEHDAIVKARNKYDGVTALMYAAQSNDDLTIIKTLIEAGADPNSIDIHSRSAFMHAVQNENVPAVEYFLKMGANPNHRDRLEWTPLLYAARDHTDPTIINMLLEAGADPTVKTNTVVGETAFDLMGRNSNLKNSEIYWKLNKLQYE